MSSSLAHLPPLPWWRDTPSLGAADGRTKRSRLGHTRRSTPLTDLGREPALVAMDQNGSRFLGSHNYLDQGVPKAEIARRVGVSRRTVYHWIETGQLDRELDAEPVRYGPRRRAPSKLDPYKAVIDDRLATYPKLSATRLYRELRESGYDGSCSQVKRYVRGVRPGAEAGAGAAVRDAAGPSGSGGLCRLRAAVGQALRAGGGAGLLADAVAPVLRAADDGDGGAAGPSGGSATSAAASSTVGSSSPATI